MTVALVIAALLVANALFVAAEFALIGTPRATIDNQAARGDIAAERVKHLLDSPAAQDRFLATSQIGISLASIGLGMYGEHELAIAIEGQLHGWGGAGWVTAHTLASVIALTLLTYFHIVIGEIMPKALTLQRPARTIMLVAPVMAGVETALSPLVRVLTGAGTLVLRGLGVAREAASADRYHSTDELKLIIEESERGGLLEGESVQVLRALFAFDDLTARQVMVPLAAVVGVPMGAPPEQLRLIVHEKPHTRYLVFDSSQSGIAGSVHIKALLRLMRQGERLRLEETTPVPEVTEGATLDSVLATMRGHHAQLATVIGESGLTVGLITMEDLGAEILGTIDEVR